MRNFIAALSFAALAQALAYADDSYGATEPNRTQHVASADCAPSADGATGKDTAAAPSPRELDV